MLHGDSNKLNHKPLLNFSDDFVQVVKISTRLDQLAILATIICNFSHLYKEAVAKPPLERNTVNGKPSDHKIVVWEPISSN